MNSTANALSLAIGNNATDSNIFITNTGAGKANLNVEGTITGGSLGTSGSRWSTIYADTINFLTGLTNADNTAGPNSTINLGTAGADSAEVHIGNSTANVSINDSNWSISGSGDANFASIGATTPGTGIFTTFSTSGLAILNSLNVNNDVAITRNVTIGGTLGVSGATTLGNKLTVTSGGLDILGSSDFRNDIDLHGHDISGAGDITASGTISGTLSSTGSLDMNNNNINAVDNILASGTISGEIDATGGYNSNIKVKGSDGNDCDINVAHGIITGTTCP